MKKILCVMIITTAFLSLMGCGHKGKEYKMKYPLKVVEVTTEAPKLETEMITTEAQPEIETEALENLSEAATEPFEDIYEEVEEVYVEDATGAYLGHYELTAYTHTGNPMANGEYPYVGACACNSLDLGTVVYIDGYGTFTVCDRGGMADNVIDIFMDTYDECIQFGRQAADVYVAQ